MTNTKPPSLEPPHWVAMKPSDSEARVAEQRGQESEQRDPSLFGLPLEVYFKAVEQAPVAISITDPKANVLYSNHAFAKVTGFPYAEVKNRNESILSDRRTPSIVYESLWSALLRHRPWTGKLVNRKRTGERYVAELTVAPVLDEAQNTIHYLGMHRDVTEQHTLEQAVRNQRALIDSLLDYAPMWFAALREDGSVALSNAPFRDAAETYTGEGALEELLLNALCGDRQRFGEFRKARAPIPEREIEVPLAGGEGVRRVHLMSRWLEESDSSADAFFSSSGARYFLIFASDLTTLRQQEEGLRMNAMRALVAEEERVQELQEIINAAVFRFELPINLLSTALRSARRRGNDPVACKALVDAVADAVGQGRELLERLSGAVPEVPDAPREGVALGGLLHEVMKLQMHRLMAEDIVVDMVIPELPTIRGVAGQLRVLFKELIDNAIEAMGSGGERGVLVEAAVVDSRVIVSISDTGPGIPDALRYKVFEPFFSRRRHKKDGAGMGLSRVQNIVSNHRGTVYVDPAYQRGCRMIVELPTGETD